MSSPVRGRSVVLMANRLRPRSNHVLVVVVLALLVACSRGPEEPPLPTTPHPGPSFPKDTTMEGIQSTGVLRVGIATDQPGFAVRNSVTGQIDGFDREIAQLIAQALFGTRRLEESFHRVAFEPLAPDGGDRMIAEGGADIVLTAYAVEHDVRQRLDFAGPYFVATREVAVMDDASSVTNAAGLAGKQVCVANDPGPRTRQPIFEQSRLVVDTSAGCADAVKVGRVAAMSADSSTMTRIMNQDPGVFKLLGDGRGNEFYVVGVRKGDDRFRAFLNDRLEQIAQSGDWAAAFDRTLGTMGLPRPEPPKVNRYPARTAPSTANARGRTTTTIRR